MNVGEGRWHANTLAVKKIYGLMVDNTRRFFRRQLGRKWMRGVLPHQAQ